MPTQPPTGPPIPGGAGSDAGAAQQQPEQQQSQSTWNPNQDIAYTPNRDMPWSPQQDISNAMGASYPNIGPYGPMGVQMMGQGLPQQSMACGGIVDKPTLARLGERGPEAVIQLAPRMKYQRRS